MNCFRKINANLRKQNKPLRPKESKRLMFPHFSPVFACEWIRVGHWSCFLLARLSSWIYVNWPCLGQPLKGISLLESEGRRGCRPSWVSSGVCGDEGQKGLWSGTTPPPPPLPIEHSPSGSNPSITHCPLTHVNLSQSRFPCGRSCDVHP